MWGDTFGPGAYGTGLYAALIEKNRPDEVIERVSRDPVTSDRYLAFAYALKGDYQSAVSYANRFVGLMNRNFQPWMELANLQGHAGDIDGGLRSLKHALDLLPRLDPSQWRKGVERGWGKDEVVTEALGGGIDKILQTRAGDPG